MTSKTSLGRTGCTFCSLVLAFLALNASAFGQSTTVPYPPHNPLPGWVLDNVKARTDFERMTGGTREPNFNTMEARARAAARAKRGGNPTLTKEERRRMEVLTAANAADIAAYSDLLGRKGTGIIRLFPSNSCLEKGVVHVGGDCEKTIFGYDAVTFRRSSVDLTYAFDKLKGTGFFSQYLLTKIGNVDITDLAAGDPRFNSVESFIPGETFAEAKKQYQEIDKGLKLGNETYSNSTVPEANSTYVLRIVAYKTTNNIQSRARALKGVVPGDPSFQFYNLRDDKRIDTLLAFRVIRKEDDGSITLVWKQLSEKDAPKIIFAEGEKWEDFK